MSNGNHFGTETHRERERGRKAFWIIGGALVVAGSVYALWAAPHLQSDEIDPAELARLRSSAVELSASAVDTFLDATTEIWPELTPDQRDVVLRHWQRRFDP